MSLDHIEIYNQPDCILPKSFFEGRYIPSFHKESLDYEQWWEEQTNRCLNGWSDGGYSITPQHYYHLNFKKIVMLNEYQQETIDHPYFAFEDQQLFSDIEIARKARKGIILITGRGFGKCLAKGTKIIMYDGRVLEVEKVKNGDLVMGPDSMPRRVLSTTSGIDDMYEVVQNQGMSYTVNSEHILSLRRNPGSNHDGWTRYPEYGEVCNINVTDYIAKSKKFKQTFSGYRHKGINFPTTSTLIDPYWLGLWLGDGNNHNTGITSIDSEVVDTVYSYATKLGMKVTINQNKNKTCPTYTINSGRTGRRNPLISLLRHYNLLRNKHIPVEYSRNDYNTRLSLLAGLIDSDGYYKLGGYSFTLKDEQLIKDIAFIANSLGFKTKLHKKRRKIKSIGFEADYWYINIYGNVDIIPCRLSRKKARVSKNKDPYITAIKEVKYKGKDEYYGFSVDGDHLFLLEDGTVTHNSFCATSIAEHRFIFYPATEIIMSASEALFVDKLWQKLDIGLNNLPDDLRPTLLQDTSKAKESGMEVFENGKKKKVGFRSMISKVIYDNNEGATRGTRPAIHIFEEIGSWTGFAKLIDCYKATKPSWYRGMYMTCFPLLIGTGGQMKNGGSKDAERMFWNPEAYDLMSFEYPDQKWYGGKKCGKFFSCYEKFEGFYEKSGISDKIAAKIFHDQKREKNKSDLAMYLQDTMEFPFTPYEAFRVEGTGIFDRKLIEDRYNIVNQDPELKNIVQRGRLEFISKTNLKLGVKWIKDKNGNLEILEHPEWEVDDKVDSKIPHLYVSGCDSYDAVGETSVGPDSRSKGSIFIFKRFWKPEKTGKIFVAKCTIRERNASAFYWETVKLNMYYNCKMLYEHTNKGIANHYIINELSEYLYARPKLEEINVIRKTQVTNRFGLVMPYEIKVHCIQSYADYIDNYYENLYFLSQMEDALQFQFGSSTHDETMACSLAVVADRDMYNVAIEERKKAAIKFPTFKTVYGKQVFQ